MEVCCTKKIHFHSDLNRDVIILLQYLADSGIGASIGTPLFNIFLCHMHLRARVVQWLADQLRPECDPGHDFGLVLM